VLGSERRIDQAHGHCFGIVLELFPGVGQDGEGFQIGHQLLEDRDTVVYHLERHEGDACEAASRVGEALSDTGCNLLIANKRA
jgi:hypothetical protein